VGRAHIDTRIGTRDRLCTLRGQSNALGTDIHPALLAQQGLGRQPVRWQSKQGFNPYVTMFLHESDLKWYVEMPHTTWESLNRRIEKCTACPRLIEHCARVAATKRRAYQNFNYWGRPVANFGDANARMLIVGLAPGAHGANRTGRMFTGDRSGDWLYRALYKAGFANQSSPVDLKDGLQLSDCAITAVCHCAPPRNKPTAKEVAACRPWLHSTIKLLPTRVFLTLGQLAWKATLEYVVASGLLEGKRPRFAHGAQVSLRDGRSILASYHPSQQNTFTGRLTEDMLDDVFVKARGLLARQNM